MAEKENKSFLDKVQKLFKRKLPRAGFVLIVVLSSLVLFVSLFGYAKLQGEQFLHLESRPIEVKEEKIGDETRQVLYSQWHEGNQVEKEGYHFRRYVLSDELTISADPGGLQNMMTLLEETGMRAERHKKSMLYFYYFNYALIVLQALFGLVATALGLMITKNGWSNAGRFSMLLFFITAGFVYTLNVLPESLRVEENISENKSYYLTHAAIRDHIYLFLTTGETVDGDTPNMVQFERYVRGQLTRYHTISIGFDQVVSRDLSQELLRNSGMHFGPDESALEAIPEGN